MKYPFDGTPLVYGTIAELQWALDEPGAYTLYLCMSLLNASSSSSSSPYLRWYSYITGDREWRVPDESLPLHPSSGGEHLLTLYDCHRPHINASVTVYISSALHRAAIQFITPSAALTTRPNSLRMIVYDREVVEITVALPLYFDRIADELVLQLWQRGKMVQVLDPRDG